MPPKKKGSNKKPEQVKPPTLINGLTKDEISKEQLEEYIARLREELDREKEERNYFQLERDKIQSFREVTDRKLDEVKAELKNLEKAIEDDEAHHHVEIKVFRQKMKHLLCEHQNTVSELESDILASAEVLQDEHNQMEGELCKEMITILVDMQELNSEDIFKEFQLKHEEEMAAAREKWEKLLAETAAKNQGEIQQLQQEHDNIMKSVICERELLWKSHFGSLSDDVNRSMNDTKDLIFTLGKDTGKEIKALKEWKSKKMLELKKMKETFYALLKENERFAGVVAKTKNEFNQLERRAKSFSQTEDPLKNPQIKALKNLITVHNDLKQEFNKLQIEMEELGLSIPQKIQSVQKQADLSLSPLEEELQALKDRLEKIQAQFHSLLSASNVDQTAVTEITQKVEKDLEARNSAIKDLKHKRFLVSKARSDMLRTEGYISF